jgi:lysozyme
MNIDRSKLAADLKRDEGVVPYGYYDSLGYLTIGVGRLIDRRKGGRLSPEEIDLLLSNDLEQRILELHAAAPWVATLDEVRQRALVNMAFQLGVAGFLGFETTLGFIREKKFNAAAVQMLKSRWARQTPERALRIAQMVDLGNDP